MARRQGPTGEPVDFTGPSEEEAQPGVFVGPGMDPQAAAYADAARARMAKKKQQLPKYTEQAGGPPVNIPNLDNPHQDGMTMASQAAQARMAATQHMRQPQQAEDSIVQMPSQQAVEPHRTAMESLNILPSDVLPQEAQKDPNFNHGMGSMVAAGQPSLAAKYGVVRKGQHIPPQKLKDPQRSLSPGTVKDLETLQKLQEQQQAGQVKNLHQSEKAAADSLSGTSADASQEVGNPPTVDKTGDFDHLDEFDFDDFRQRMMKDILNNPDQREIIEGRLKELEIEDMIMHNRVTQDIPVVPGKFWFTLKSMTTEEDLAVKRLIMQESKSVEVSDRYLLDKYALLGMAIALDSINGKPLGADHLDKDGNFDDAKLIAKFNRILKLPVHMLASVGVNHFWFEQRVRKLFVAEKVGNG